MLEVGWFSTKLLFKGKLLQNPGYFTRETAAQIRGKSVGHYSRISLCHRVIDALPVERREDAVIIRPRSFWQTSRSIQKPMI